MTSHLDDLDPTSVLSGVALNRMQLSTVAQALYSAFLADQSSTEEEFGQWLRSKGFGPRQGRRILYVWETDSQLAQMAGEL